MTQQEHPEELRDLVSEFLAREVGEPEEEAQVDAVTLLDLIRQWEEDAGYQRWPDKLEVLSALTDWFNVFYDEDRDVQPAKWHIAVYADGHTVDIHNEDLDVAIQEAISLCTNQ